jgi:hypothetical protein
MGIPYSREINSAFDQVTPLVAAGFKVLKTTKNISILLAVIQVLTCVFLAMILAVLIGLVYCVNPELEVRAHSFLTLDITRSVVTSSDVRSILVNVLEARAGPASDAFL